jgi:hypothetical protein
VAELHLAPLEIGDLAGQPRQLGNRKLRIRAKPLPSSPPEVLERRRAQLRVARWVLDRDPMQVRRAGCYRSGAHPNHQRIGEADDGPSGEQPARRCS